MKLTNLGAIDAESRAVRAVIEAPRGSRNKFKYVPEHDAFMLDRILPQGSAFPTDFGFVPSTLAEDGDPLDILVFADEPLVVGCLVLTRVIGAILATQTEPGHKRVRNDRLIGVAREATTYRSWRNLDDLGSNLVTAIEQFFISYHTVQGRTFRPVSRDGPTRAQRLLRQGIRRAEDRQE